jgi:small subunit ribosomal protein S20
MAHSLSAKKRVRQNAKRRLINRWRRGNVKSLIKHFDETLKTGDKAAVNKEYRVLVKKLDQTASTSTMHKNTAARIKSRLAKKLNSLKG